MTLEEISALPVRGLAAADCALFLWARSPALPEALEVIKAWGFAYKTVAFNWVKVDDSGKPRMGCGSYTRPSTELCLLAIKGKMKVRDHGVHQTILAPRREHSRKPVEQYGRIEKLFDAEPRLEMFARQRHVGWDPWGNETEKFEQTDLRCTVFDDMWI